MGNAFRDARKQRNLVLDCGLDVLLVGVARGRGVSVNGLLVSLIEEVCGVGGDSGSGVGVGVASSGVGVGASGGRVGDGYAVGVFGAGGFVDPLGDIA